MKSGRFGLTTISLVITLLVVISLIGAFVLTKGGPSGTEDTSPDVFEVRRGGFDITIPASGELAALNQTEVSSRLESRATITFIVDEGTMVKQGDVLIRLNAEDILNNIKDAEDTKNTAEAAWITAKSDLDIHVESSASQLAQANVDVKLAQLGLLAWQEGDNVSKQQTLTLDVETSKKDYDRLKDRFEQSTMLLEQEFISKDEYSRDEIDMIRARSKWQQAKLALEVYEKYTAEEERERLTSDYKQAEDRRSETTQRNENKRVSLAADLESKSSKLENRRDRLEKWRRQLEACTIIAPQDGLVIYASSLSTGRWGRNDNTPPQVGTELPRNRTVMVLPDTSKMVAEVKVNEALTGRILAGQPATIFSDALPDTPLEGEVLGVGVLAEGGSWRDPNRRDYTVRVQVNGGADLGLKPSMRCKAEIKVGRVEDAVFIPVPSIFRQGPSAYVYVEDGAGYAPRIVDVGRASELYIEVLGGVSEGERVLLREPPAGELTVDLDEVLASVQAPTMAGGGPPRTGGMPGAGKPGMAKGRPEGTRGKGGGRPVTAKSGG